MCYGVGETAYAAFALPELLGGGVLPPLSWELALLRLFRGGDERAVCVASVTNLGKCSPGALPTSLHSVANTMTDENMKRDSGGNNSTKYKGKGNRIRTQPDPGIKST